MAGSLPLDLIYAQESAAANPDATVSVPEVPVVIQENAQKSYEAEDRYVPSEGYDPSGGFDPIPVTDAFRSGGGARGRVRHEDYGSGAFAPEYEPAN